MELIPDLHILEDEPAAPRPGSDAEPVAARTNSSGRSSGDQDLDARRTPSQETAGHRQVYIETYGCQMNVSDSEIVASVLRKNGFGLKL